MLKIDHLAKSFTQMQKVIKQSGPAMNASYTMIGSVILLGAIGYGIDDWQNTSPVFLLVGLLIGILIGFYEIAKTIWTKSDK